MCRAGSSCAKQKGELLAQEDSQRRMPPRSSAPTSPTFDTVFGEQREKFSFFADNRVNFATNSSC